MRVVIELIVTLLILWLPVFIQAGTTQKEVGVHLLVAYSVLLPFYVWLRVFHPARRNREEYRRQVTVIWLEKMFLRLKEKFKNIAHLHISFREYRTFTRSNWRFFKKGWFVIASYPSRTYPESQIIYTRGKGPCGIAIEREFEGQDYLVIDLHEIRRTDDYNGGFSSEEIKKLKNIKSQMIFPVWDMKRKKLVGMLEFSSSKSPRKSRFYNKFFEELGIQCVEEISFLFD